MPLQDLATVMPELFVACSAMVLLMLGVFRGNQGTRSVLWLTVGVIAVTFFWLTITPTETAVAFGGLVVTDGFGNFMKLLVLLGAGLTIGMSLGYIEREQMARFEFPVLMLFATLGMMMMVSA